MFRLRSLFLFSGLLFYTAFGNRENVGKSEITEDFNDDNSRTDAEQDPFTSTTLASQAGDPQSTLFSSCLTKSRTFEAKFASIEIVLGSEYIRYVPDSRQSSFPISWKSVTGIHSSILDCAKAVHDGGWPMFKYNGVKCEVVNTTYSLNDVPKCENTNSDAVFILSTAVVDCPIPRFFVGYNNFDKAVCGLVNEDLMTYDEAKSYCSEVYPNSELTLFVNEHLPLTLQNVSYSFTQLGYTKTNLWVDAVQSGQGASDWYGGFTNPDWWDGQFPVTATYGVAYLDKDANFKLRWSEKSFKAGVLCISMVTSTSLEG